MPFSDIILVEGPNYFHHALGTQLEALGIRVLASLTTCDELTQVAETHQPQALLMDCAFAGDALALPELEACKSQLHIPVLFFCPADRPELIPHDHPRLASAFIFTPFTAASLRLSLELAAAAPCRHSWYHQHQEENLYIKRNRRYQRLPVTEILYIQASGAYCVVVTKDQEFTLAINLNTLEKALNTERLVRVHRSYIINLENIEGFEGNTLFSGGKMIPISSTYRPLLAQAFPMIDRKGLVL
ncbi:MAG: LytTR family DNA-binding domain-containing protein [Bacteroidota bacterium]